MTTIALFHSVLGVRPGILDAAERLGAAGHTVHVVDQYDGRTFDDYESAGAFADSLGFPELMRRALTAVESLPDGFVAAGFSNGAGMAEYVAVNRPVSGVLMFAGALPLEYLDGVPWPSGVPGQIHSTLDDPYRDDDNTESVAHSIREAGGAVEVFDYPGSGHLFTDASMVDEFDPESAALFWERVLAFLARIDH